MLWVLCSMALFALLYTAGGLFYLEQRVPFIRQRDERWGRLAALIGWAALFLGVLMGGSLAGILAQWGRAPFVLSVLAALGGVLFWGARIRIAVTARQRRLFFLYLLLHVGLVGLLIVFWF